MMQSLPEPEPLRELVQALKRLPGIGERSARRIAWHMLERDRTGARMLSEALNDAMASLRHCRLCNSFTQSTLCEVCSHPHRDASLLCIVETPADQHMVEASHGYQGLYYVLMGRLAPLEGIGPGELQFDQLLKRAQDERLKEVILATNFTAEGETTAHYLQEALQEKGLKVTRLARGVPAGGELEYVDASTIAWALMERR